MQGLKRLLAQLHDGEQTDDTVDAAEAWVMKRRDWTGRQLMDHVQDLVGDRILVDKTPANTESPEVLSRIVKAYPKASYLQLTRHPRPRGKSSYKAISGVLDRQVAGSIPVPDVELKWAVTHGMLQVLSSRLGLGQAMWLQGETFLRNMRFYLPQVCEWLGIRSDDEAIEEMLHPERSVYACIGPHKAPRGNNSGFLKNPALDHEKLASMSDASLDGPLEWAPERSFLPSTRRLAHEFGYR